MELGDGLRITAGEYVAVEAEQSVTVLNWDTLDYSL